MSRNNTGISKGIDPLMIWLYLLLVGVGILAIFAATYREGDPVISSFFSLFLLLLLEHLFYLLTVNFLLQQPISGMRWVFFYCYLFFLFTQM